MAKWIGGNRYQGAHCDPSRKCYGCSQEIGECDCQWIACPVCGDLCYIGKGTELDDYYTCYRGCGYSTVKEWD